MIKYSVKNHPYSFFMTFLHKILQILIGAQTAVQLLIICRFITMSYGLKQGTYIKRLHPISFICEIHGTRFRSRCSGAP